MFIPVAIYNYTDSAFIGYGIKDEKADKLQSTNIWREGEEDKLNERLAALNAEIDLNKHWPHPQDPEVVALLDDPTFMPIEYIEAEVIDDEASTYVWKKEAETDEHGDFTGRLVDGSELDEGASTIIYKIGKVPKRPTDVMWRIKAASEQVARRRATMVG